ncbi:acylneuraminate cytidylyltransferase family protein [Flavivirga eckloniae]|uniref:Acylneuraminate cytidylyltransferase family protein n=1 Tax=Flavivirga eckloniae TaxID=1803846 RepID=A0A2K9PM80_9FLAO|nr:acylneuraminate cytidylyltransferase family protein [Flavivirga eckloniae]AUP78173.1 acylneuraminate cytidylyltransferase family protein [Flavivirga eckloniae]
MKTNKLNKTFVVIIPARGGSERLPKKNVLPLKNKPLIEYSIDFAKSNLDYVEKIVVTTDDQEIKRIALKNNVQVIDRPKEISGNKASTVSALKHALLTLNETYDFVILLQPTNPLRPKNLLKSACDKIIEEGADSLITVTKNHHKLGKIVNNTYEPFLYNMGQRSQDLEPLYYENGLLYITKRELILDDKIISNNNIPVIVDHAFANVDIDTMDDFKLAEFTLEQQKDE